MSVHYFIDGYNLIWSTEIFGTGEIRTLRERLLFFLEQTRQMSSTRNQMTVIFDGKIDVESPPWKGSVKVVFSKGTDADAVIKNLVDELSNPRAATVVSDDRDIQRWVRAARAKIMPCEEFLEKSVRKKKNPAEAEKPTLDETAHLNRELLRLWKMD